MADMNITQWRRRKMSVAPEKLLSASISGDSTHSTFLSFFRKAPESIQIRRDFVKKGVLAWYLFE
jgi:hypothetical protein